MTGRIVITDIIELVSRLRDKIDRYRDALQRNEMLTRYALIDPFLRALGWDTEDPGQVEPEFNTEAGVPDYALKMSGEIVAFVEAKALGKRWDTLKLVSYANAKGVPYVIATDGDRWEVYDVFKPVEVGKKLIASWQVTGDSPAEIALKALILANLADREVFGSPLGGPPLTLSLTKRVAGNWVEEESVEGQKEQKVVEGPLSTRLARVLILQILAETGKPMRMKDIVEEVGKRVRLTERDMEKTKSGKARWKANVGWIIPSLAKEGLIERVGEGIYRITSKGLEELRKQSG